MEKTLITTIPLTNDATNEYEIRLHKLMDELYRVDLVNTAEDNKLYASYAFKESSNFVPFAAIKTLCSEDMPAIDMLDNHKTNFPNEVKTGLSQLLKQYCDAKSAGLHTPEPKEKGTTNNSLWAETQAEDNEVRITVHACGHVDKTITIFQSESGALRMKADMQQGTKSIELSTPKYVIFNTDWYGIDDKRITETRDYLEDGMTITDDEIAEICRLDNETMLEDQKKNLVIIDQNLENDETARLFVMLGERRWFTGTTYHTIIISGVASLLEKPVEDFEVFSNGINIIRKESYHDGTIQYELRMVEGQKGIDEFMAYYKDLTTDDKENIPKNKYDVLKAMTKPATSVINETFGWT